MKSQYLVFVVDDDPIYREMLKDQLLYSPRLDIETFSTGEKCLEQLHRKPDIIVLDYFLNLQSADAKDGLEILKEIREELPDVKVIALSAQLLPDITFDFIFTQNVSNYIVKEENAFQNLKTAVESIIQDLDNTEHD